MEKTPRDRWPAWADTFLDRLAETGLVATAARETGVSTSTANNLRRADEEFATAWDAALDQAYDKMEIEMQRRAFSGTDEPVYHQGEVVGRVTKYSDRLAMFLMTGYRKRKFASRTELTGPDGAGLGISATVNFVNPDGSPAAPPEAEDLV